MAFEPHSAITVGEQSDVPVVQLPLICGVAQPRPRSLLRLLHVVGVAGVMAFATAVLALHGLRTDLNPASQSISEYSVGNYGWLMRVAFAALALGAAATALRLHFELPSSYWRFSAVLFLVASAVGLFLDAGFNTDHLGVRETFDGTFHGDGTLILCLTLPAASYISGSVLVDSPRPTSRGRWLQALGPGQLIAIFGFQFGQIAYHGLMERVGVAMGVAALALLQSTMADATDPCRSNEVAESPLRA